MTGNSEVIHFGRKTPNPASWRPRPQGRDADFASKRISKLLAGTLELIALLPDNNVEMLERLLSVFDLTRALDLLERLSQHRTHSWALSGGLAIEIHVLRAGLTPRKRSLNDMDFIATGFADIPRTLAKNFLFRHVHPEEVPGRIMVQFVDMETKLRIDVFRAAGASTTRAIQLALPTGEMRIVAVEDLIARTARLSLDLADGIPVPAKHAEDFLRLSELIASPEVQPAWGDHRKPEHPLVFRDAMDMLLELIQNRKDLLIVPEYSKDVTAECSRCVPTSAFPLADLQVIFSALGYC